MPKNLMKVNIFEPYEPQKTPKLNHHFNNRFKSTPTSYSFHFDTKLMGGSFYIDWEQIPQFVMDKTVTYREKLGSKILYAPSAPELREKINELFKAYQRELSEIKYDKKIGVKFYNSLSKMHSQKEELSISIKYIVFYTKAYIGEDGEVQDILNVSSKEKHDTKVDIMGFDIYDYSDELEESIVGLQQKMHNGMKEFMSAMTTKEDIISHFQPHNLIENKSV